MRDTDKNIDNDNDNGEYDNPNPNKDTGGHPCRSEREDFLSRCLEGAICELHHDYYTEHKDRLRQLVRKSLSFPKTRGSHKDRRNNNNNNNSSSSNNNSNNNNNNKNTGKPHDAESRIALTLYHQWKREAASSETKTNSNSNSNNNNNSSSNSNGTLNQQTPSSSPKGMDAAIVTLVSAWGLTRSISSPKQLADAMVPLLEDRIRSHPEFGMVPDVRSQASGILSMISVERSLWLRNSGRLPCPHCIQWCKGEKGLWWHQQQSHRLEYSTATNAAQSTSIGAGAMVVYDPKSAQALATAFAATTTRCKTNHDDHRNSHNDSNNDSNNKNNDDNNNKNKNKNNEDPMDCVRSGNLPGLKRAVEEKGYRPSADADARGSTPLLWAAGGGHLEMVRYLVEVCDCDPRQSQTGKRSFRGRTALHWAARNGHPAVVTYLLSLASDDGGDDGDDDGDGDDVTPHDTKTKTIKDDGHARSGQTRHRKPTLAEILEAKTQDGTTAFGWACWQRHLPVMEILSAHGCDMHGVNSFGCSPVLWCSQGTDSGSGSGNGSGKDHCNDNDNDSADKARGVEALKWLRSRGCNLTLVNHNGHGVLHKAAQRGQADVARWMVQDQFASVLRGDGRPGGERWPAPGEHKHKHKRKRKHVHQREGEQRREHEQQQQQQQQQWQSKSGDRPQPQPQEPLSSRILTAIGPDSEGYCPSDLAGMEGHEDLALWLAETEIRVCLALGSAPTTGCANASRASPVACTSASATGNASESESESPTRNATRNTSATRNTNTNTNTNHSTSTGSTRSSSTSTSTFRGDRGGVGDDMAIVSSRYHWEPFGGLRRMRSALLQRVRQQQEQQEERRKQEQEKEQQQQQQQQ